MTPERWQAIKPILESALELDPTSRAAYLDQACADASIRVEIESLLLSHDQASTQDLSPGSLRVDFLKEEASSGLPSGLRIGAYEILGEIGIGGMGNVYRAVRADGQYRQEVALKIVRSDMSGGQALIRFKNERQILASLDHPNIAKILDGGTTPGGLPYFVMELIDGLPITEYCDKHQSTIDQRLKMFRAVCSAVHYAHQHLVIHRDIKPTNILVTSEGAPKLLDFGIAKILDSRLLPESATLTAGWLMTPDYASPEQLRGAAITTATDIYSLGLVLYQLLSGRRAHRFASRMPHEIARAIFDADPEKPSTAARHAVRGNDADSATLDADPQTISNSRGGVSPEKLQRRLTGDLDNVVMKAIRKEPAERYSSVDHLSEDLRRYTEGLPVLARKGTFTYRTRKFVMRHKTSAGAAALVLITLIVGLVMTLREARIARANQVRAEKRFNDVRKLAHSLLFEIHDSIRDLSGATPARKLLVNKALEYLDSLSQEAAGDTSLQRELASAYERVGDVQGNPYNANLGDISGAVGSYRKALGIRESLDAGKDRTDEDDRALANDYERLGTTLQFSGNYDGALQNCQKTLAIRTRLAAKKPTPESQEEVAGAYFDIGATLSQMERNDDALKNYEQAASIREGVLAGNTLRFPHMAMRLAGTYAYASVILYDKGRYDQALQMQQRVTQIMKALFDSDPKNAAYQEYYYEAWWGQGLYLESKKEFPRARSSYQQAMAGFQILHAADPNEVRPKRFIALCDRGLGNILVNTGKTREGLVKIREGLRLLEQLSRVDPAGNVNYFADVADTYAAIGSAESMMAGRVSTSPTEKAAHRTEACAAYQSSMDGWLKVRQRETLGAYGADQLQKVTREVDQCKNR